MPQGVCRSRRGIVVDEWSNTYRTFEACAHLIQEDGGMVAAVASVVDFGEGREAFSREYPNIKTYNLIDMERDAKRLKHRFTEELIKSGRLKVEEGVEKQS